MSSGEERIHATLLLCTVQAKSLVTNMKQYNGESSCSTCLDSGQTVGKKQPSQGMASYSKHEVQNTQVHGKMCLLRYKIRQASMFAILNSVLLESYSLIVMHVLII